MKTTKTRTTLSAGLCLALALTLIAPVVFAKGKKSKEPVLEAYSGHYINVNAGSVRSTNFINLEIHRWTTDEERQTWLQTLADKGSDKMISEMRDDKESVGSVRLPGTVSYDLKYARVTNTDKGRQLVLATDRPLAMREVAYNRRTTDYGMTIIEFVMPSNGQPGEGTIIVGAELEFESDGTLNIESASMNPLRLQDVKLKPAKKKKK